MIPVLYTDNGQRSKKLIEALTKKHVTFEKRDVRLLDDSELRKLTTKMREMRPKITRTQNEHWSGHILRLPPIIETKEATYSWWYIERHQDEIIKTMIVARPAGRATRLRIKKIRRNQNSTTIYLSDEAIARINITVLRMLNGKNLFDIINEWPMGERATFNIAWRMCQHIKANKLRILIDMIENEASTSDPYTKQNNTWHGDMD